VPESASPTPEAPPSDSPRRRRRWFLLILLVLLAGLGVGLGLALSGGSSSALGPEGVPLQNAPDLAAASTSATGAPVDGVTCRAWNNQSLTEHFHVRISIYVGAKLERVPGGVGITAPAVVQKMPGGDFIDTGQTDCLYWLHTHTNDGIIHVESPIKATFTLGQFFDVWRQPLGPQQVGPAHGPVTALIGGRTWAGDPRDIPLLDNSVIQLDVGTPVEPFHPLAFHVKGSCGEGSTNCAAGG